MQKCSEYQEAFKALGNAEAIEKKEKKIPIIEKFVCQMDGSKCSKLHDARYEKFLATYNTSNSKIFIHGTQL